MGLGRWLLVKLASAFGVLPHQYVRRYKVTLFGESLGAYVLPIADHMENPQALVRPVLTRPFRMELGDQAYYYWAEPNQNEGGFKVVQWDPPTPELREEIDNLYRSAHGLNADFSVNPTLQPPLPTRTVEETRLIRAILADREAEQPYRDYAAWLSAKGDAYGDYIRLTWDIEKLPEGDQQRERLEKQREKLVEKHGPKWALPLADLGLYPGLFYGGSDAYYPTIWFGPKGVIEELDVDCGSLVFPLNGPRLFVGAPFLRKLRVNRLGATVRDFAAIPQMAQIESLSLSIGHGTTDDYLAFARSPHLGGLRELDLSGYRFGPTAAQHLADAAWLANVHTLDLGYNAVTDDGAEAVAESPNVANLVTFEFNSNELTDRGLIALCRSPHLGKLTALDVSGNTFTAEGMSALTTAPFAANLHTLNLSSCDLDTAAFGALASGVFPALKTLDVSYNAGGGPAAVAGAPFFRGLEVFRATYNESGIAVALAIAGVGFTQLRELNLNSNHLSDDAIIALARSKAVTKLIALDLSDNPFGLEGVRALAAADLPLLESLDLSRVPMGRPGAQALADSPHFKKLTRLVVSEEQVGLIGRQLLEKRFHDGIMSFY